MSIFYIEKIKYCYTNKFYYFFSIKNFDGYLYYKLENIIYLLLLNGQYKKFGRSKRTRTLL